MPARWPRTSSTSGKATSPTCVNGRERKRGCSAGSAAWKRCSAPSIPKPSRGEPPLAPRAHRRSLASSPRPDPDSSSAETLSQATDFAPHARPWHRPAVDAPYAKLEQVEPGIARVLAHNPSAFTYYGTQTYLVGDAEVAVIDPGPDLPEHVDALEEAIGGRPVVAIMCTHTHRDHSPAARPLAERVKTPVIGCAPLSLESVGPRSDAAFDGDYAPDRALADGESLEVDGKRITAVATPGHTSNHLCFAYERALLTVDHVMGWSTTVVVPPDGDMAAYMQSLGQVRKREERIYYPAHGPA